MNKSLMDLSWKCNKDGEQNNITFTLQQSQYNILNLNTMFLT